MDTPQHVDPLTARLRQAAMDALEDVDSIGTAGEDRAIVLKALLDVRLNAAHVSTAAPAPPARLSATDVETFQEPVLVDDSDLLGKMSGVLKIDRDTLEQVYDVRDGQPYLVVSPKKISSNKAQATRQIGQLVVVGRQAAGIEEWTSVSIVRSTVQEYGRLDSGNFASNIQQIDSVCVIRGKGQGREFKVTRPGFEETAEFLTSLMGQAT